MAWKDVIWNLAKKLELDYERGWYSPVHAWNAIVAELERLRDDDLSDCYYKFTEAEGWIEPNAYNASE